MSKEEFIRIYGCSPKVPLKDVYRLTNRRHSTIYEMNRRGEIRIEKIGSRSFLDIDTVYRLACQPSTAAA